METSTVALLPPRWRWTSGANDLVEYAHDLQGWRRQLLEESTGVANCSRGRTNEYLPFKLEVLSTSDSSSSSCCEYGAHFAMPIFYLDLLSILVLSSPSAPHSSQSLSHPCAVPPPLHGTLFPPLFMTALPPCFNAAFTLSPFLLGDIVVVVMLLGVPTGGEGNKGVMASLNLILWMKEIPFSFRTPLSLWASSGHRYCNDRDNVRAGRDLYKNYCVANLANRTYGKRSIFRNSFLELSRAPSRLSPLKYYFHLWRE